jgi:hypothetical protein
MKTSKTKYRFLVWLLILAAAATRTAGAQGQSKPPRAATGQPDLQGVWNFSSDVPLERPTAFADRETFTREELRQHAATTKMALGTVAKFAPVEAVSLTWLDYEAQIENLRTSLITYPDNGRVPKLVEGVRRAPGIADFIAVLSDPKATLPPTLLAALGGGKKDGFEDLGPSERCLGGAGPPFTSGFDNNYVQIVQGTDHIALVTEPFHHARIVPLDGRPQLGEKLRFWSGDSRGHWEGETLVIETRNFNSRTRSFAGAGTSQDKTVTERFTRRSADALDYEATIVDPKTFEEKIVVSFPMARSRSRIFEVACHEGNYSMFNTLSGARKEEQDATKAKP